MNEWKAISARYILRALLKHLKLLGRLSLLPSLSVIVISY